jgi:hypothetical protein
MDKSTIREHILNNTSSLDISIIQEHIDCIQAFVESPYFENQLTAFVERYKQSHHKNIELPTCDELEATFIASLPYMCFVPYEIIALNPYLCDILKRSNLSHRFFAMDDILQCTNDIHEVGPYIVDVRMLKVHLLLNLPWYFMNEFMDALGLSKGTSIKENNKNVDVTVKPLDKMKKSFSDNLRIIKKKLEAGEPVVGQNQLGWLLVSQKITSDAEQLNIKDFILEDNLPGLGSVTRGLLPESQRHLDIFELYKPSRLDKRMLYDKLYFFYRRLKPDDVQFETLETRLAGLGNDPEIVRKETSKYYEVLTRKMNRYFGVEILVAHKEDVIKTKKRK